MSDDLDTTHLSDAELHDVVTVASASNEAEAMYLVNRLEESGIPVLSASEAVYYASSSRRICVPRALQKRATDIVETARAEARARALEDAFDVEEVDEKDVRKDPLLATMLQLATLPYYERKSALTPYVVEWLAAGWTNADIARHLAVAGLSPDEARTLVAGIHDNQMDRVLERRESRSTNAVFFFALSLILYLLGNIDTHRSIGSLAGINDSAGITWLLRASGIMCFLYALSQVVSPKKPSRLEEPMPKTPADSENPTKP